jgi:hypothetical protein
MKLRVRVPGIGETQRVATPEVCDVGSLRALLAARLLPPGTLPASVRLSLNGRDELVASDSVPLTGAGIRNGDLVHVLPATTGLSAAAPAQVPGVSQQPLSEELRRRRCLEAAEARVGGVAGGPPTTRPLDGDRDGDDTPMADDEAEASALPPPAQPAVPAVLRAVLAASAPSPRSLHPATALALALHAAALDSGFVDATPSVSDALSGQAPQFRYALTAGGAQLAWMRTSLVGGDVIAYGGLFTADDVLRVAVRISDHYTTLPANAPPEALPFSQLPALWMAAKDGLAAPLLRWACLSAGLVPPQPSLVSLAEHVKSLILSMLPPKALAATACVCKDLRFAASDENLWRAAYLTEFGHNGAAAGGYNAVVAARGWRVAFGAAWMARAQAERRAAMAAEMRRRPRPHIFPIPNPFQSDIPGQRFPGVIGGDYDLHPFGRGGGGGGSFGFRGGQGMFGMGGGNPIMPFGGLPQPHHHPGPGYPPGLFRSADDDATPY